MPLLLRSLIFTALAPGSVAIYVPLWIARNASAAPGWALVLGAALAGAGAVIYGWCVRDFAVIGQGTPAPIDAPRRLVVRGPYRYTRNPMYVGVLTVILGWTLLYRTWGLVRYWIVVALAFHLVIVLYEEPRLGRRFGREYEEYRSRVARWIPGAPR